MSGAVSLWRAQNMLFACVRVDWGKGGRVGAGGVLREYALAIVVDLLQYHSSPTIITICLDGAIAI